MFTKRIDQGGYVKLFLKWQKNDAADAEAIVEAALRPTMRFVAVKTVEKQACAMAFQDPGPACPVAHADHQRAACAPH